jgi:hypothetical protein
MTWKRSINNTHLQIEIAREIMTDFQLSIQEEKSDHIHDFPLIKD